MRAFSRHFAGVVLAAIVHSAFAATPAAQVTKGWVRWLPNALPAAGYATIANTGTTPIRLVGASSPDYGHVMLHRSVSENGVDRMVKSDGIDIAPGASASLAPGGYHLMLMKPTHAIEPGDTVEMKLEFADGGSVTTTMKVEPAGATGPG